nr:hypothetical protein [Tanacetum cinerariifolium]
MGRDTVQIKTAVNTISQEYLLGFTSEYGIPKTLHPELPGPEDRIVDFPEGKVGVDERVFPTIMDWRMNALKDRMPTENTYSVEAVRALDIHRTTIQKQPEMLLCLVRISRRYYLGDKVYPTFLHDDDRDMDLFNLIRAPNPTKVKIRSHPCAAHEVPLLTLTANRVVKMEESAAATDSSGVPSTIERSPLDIANEAGASDQGTMALEVPQLEDVQATSVPKAGQAEEVAATDPFAATKSRKRGHDGADVNAPLKVLRRDHVDPRPTGSTNGGKSLTAIELGLASTRPVHVPENAPAGVSDPDPLSFADPQSRHPADIAWSSQGTTVAGDPDSRNASFASVVGYPESIYRPEWGVANGSMLDTPEACGDGVTATPEELLEAEADMKKATEDMNTGLSQELEDMHARFLDLPVSNECLSQQVATLQEQVSGEEKLKAAFEEFKRYEDSRVEQRWMRAWMRSEMDALGCHRGSPIGISKGMSEGLRHGVEHGQAQLSLESIEAYDPEAEAKYVAALQASKDLKYPLVDQFEGLKDTPMDIIMAALYLESDTGDDAP